MLKKIINHQGFTLLELIMSIVIIAIIGTIAGRGLLEIAQGYVLSRKNAVVAQQGQMTAARMKKELSSIHSILCGGTNIITYTSSRNESENVTIYWPGGNNPLTLKVASGCTVCANPCAGGDILAENVSDFKLRYCTTPANCSTTFPNSPDFTEVTVSLVEVTLKLKGYDDTPITIADPDIVFLGLESES